MKFEKITAGMVLLDIHSERMGNTTMRQLSLGQVKVISVDPATRTARVSWDGNSAETWRARQLERLVAKPGKAYLDQEQRKMEASVRGDRVWGGYYDRNWLQECRPHLFDEQGNPLPPKADV